MQDFKTLGQPLLGEAHTLRADQYLTPEKMPILSYHKFANLYFTRPLIPLLHEWKRFIAVSYIYCKHLNSITCFLLLPIVRGSLCCTVLEVMFNINS